ncbi:hypothetical protein OUZ56_022392 [Daphnia magna]|uniref:Uncharacterized protein n=1 Tax=Daphnia magna TaxID=35525 RepID=A0ABR0AW90_9CRUS|nr:hypothetical protein OUZ56_022392 [Daphnia magna]
MDDDRRSHTHRELRRRANNNNSAKEHSVDAPPLQLVTGQQQLPLVREDFLLAHSHRPRARAKHCRLSFGIVGQNARANSWEKGRPAKRSHQSNSEEINLQFISFKYLTMCPNASLGNS